jgi:hypothetical protein
MSTWVKWWKDKTLLKIWGIILLTMAISFGIVIINSDSTWCIISSILAACGGGLIIRKVITKKLDELEEEYTPESKKT